MSTLSEVRQSELTQDNPLLSIATLDSSHLPADVPGWSNLGTPRVKIPKPRQRTSTARSLQDSGKDSTPYLSAFLCPLFFVKTDYRTIASG